MLTASGRPDVYPAHDCSSNIRPSARHVILLHHVIYHTRICCIKNITMITDVFVGCIGHRNALRGLPQPDPRTCLEDLEPCDNAGSVAMLDQ